LKVLKAKLLFGPGLSRKGGGGVSESEVARRLRYAGYVFQRSTTGKHLWVEPKTGARLPEERAFALVQEEERYLLTEAGWERVEVEGEHYWRRPDTGRLYPGGPAIDVLRAQLEKAP
jgi:hypothetical protein